MATREFSRNFVIFNIAVFILVKFVLSLGTFHLASLIEAIPAFDSREIISLTNQARASDGKPALSASHKLDLAAQEKLNHMAQEEYFAHISPDGITPWHWMKKTDYRYAFAGENLAIGFLKADDAVDAWMESSSHRANLLNGNYTEIGVAVATVEMGGNEGILVVQMFGRPNVVLGSQTPAGAQPGESTAVAPAVQEPDVQTSLQYVSTDPSIPAVEAPIRISDARESGDLIEIGSLANNVYVFYTFVIALVSVAMATMIHKTRLNLMKAVVHVALFVAAVIVPLLSSSVSASIF
jgi:hypothetical protein